MGKMKAADLVSAEKIALITETQRKLGGTKAKPLKEQLPESITYEEIRCVLAEMEKVDSSEMKENDQRA